MPGAVGEAYVTRRAGVGEGCDEDDVYGLAALIAIGLLPSPALAATCADYATQADAQRAAARATLM